MTVIAPDGYSQNPPQTGVDAIDTYFLYVAGRIAAQFPQIAVIGVVEARDWPFQGAVDQGIYMIVGNARNSRNVSSQQNSLATYSTRWVWQVLGTDLTQGVQVTSRGDRYRITAQLRSALRYGLYPGFTQKQQYSVADNGSGQPAYVITTPYAYESVWWSKPDFAGKLDTQSGIYFGYAAVAMSSFEPEINS